MRKNWIFLGVATLAFLLVRFAIPTTAALTPSAKGALAVAVFAIIVWVTQAVSDALSGFLIILLLVISSATNLAGSFAGFSNTSLWLIVVGFIMAAAMEKSGLSERIALSVVRLAGGSAIKIYWAIAGVMAVLTFLVPSITARTLLMMPIIMGIGQAFGAERGKSNIVKALIFIVAMSGTMMSIGVLTAHVGNPATVGLIQAATGHNVSWSEWFKVGGPPAFVLSALSVVVISLMWKPETSRVEGARDYIAGELARLGPIKKTEWYTLAVFMATLVLWATEPPMLSTIVVGIIAVILLLLPGLGVLNWKEAQEKVPWNVFMVYGAGLSMGTALTTSGAAKWLATTMFGPITQLSIPVQMIILLWFITILQVFFTGGGPKTNALTPIILAHAGAIGANQASFGLILGMNMNHQYLLPVSNMPNAVAMGTDFINTRELIRTGAVMSVLGAAFMSVMVLTYWSWLGMVG
ncbi:DASS family sodium-coupled anion symporter [Propionibacterium freudenreichii]|uniref:SLC13 family permease n=1 Tax=Propionibacterium freudenreichii TaxID=1744 RepID=UPI00254A5A9F|nr:DASS family sodium-coupled anion symporter [Propionibacterium freudenreichii]MDK9321877.1 DASS family sodium-coupled anion symporter [Propionibacterium freudenreichii]